MAATRHVSSQAPKDGPAATGGAVNGSSPPSTHSVVHSVDGHVLVVDDEELSGRATVRTLLLRGFDVDCTTRAADALERLRAGTYDAVVSDMQMPDLDGIAFLRELHQQQIRIAVVILTAHPSIESAASTVEHGGFRYLTKPFDPYELSRAVEAAVARTHELRAERATPRPSPVEPGLAERFARSLEQMWMAFQPIVSAESHQIIGYEALLRSHEKSLPHPGAIIEAAEKLGAIPQLGRAVRACVTKTMAEKPVSASIFVNLHALDLLDEALYDDRNPLVPFAHRIVLEITERASVDGITNLPELVARLRALRFRIAVDDLGTGYAGLAALSTIQPDIVKFDMSIVRGIDADPVRQRIVLAIAKLARELGMQVVAEGVETVAERDLLITLSCDFLQGFLLARPGPAFPPSVWP